MTLPRVWVVGLLILLPFVQQGSAQVGCSRALDCGDPFPVETTEEDCCVGVTDSLSVRPTAGSELCNLCFVYGWVSERSTSTFIPQTNITAGEGDTVPLTIYYTKNGLSAQTTFFFTIETSGTATVGVDYNLTTNQTVLESVPLPVNVTLLSDGVAGEGTETIVLTLVQSLLFPSGPNEFLAYDTVTITLEDSEDATPTEPTPTERTPTETVTATEEKTDKPTEKEEVTDKDGDGSGKDEGTKAADDPPTAASSGNKSGTPSWAIAIAVVIPTILLIISAGIIVAAIFVYRRNTYGTYNVSEPPLTKSY